MAFLLRALTMVVLNLTKIKKSTVLARFMGELVYQSFSQTLTHVVEFTIASLFSLSPLWRTTPYQYSNNSRPTANEATMDDLLGTQDRLAVM